MGWPKLSVVMTNYNHGRYIAGALNAIINQSFKPFEIILCDDSSTDNSVEIIEDIVRKYPVINFLKNKHNMGVVNAANYGLAHVSGDYVYFGAADDMILPDFFKKSMELLVQYPQAGISSCLSLIINGEGKKTDFVLAPLISKKSCFLPPDKVRDIFIKLGSWILGITVISKLGYLRANGGYRPELYSFSDGFIDQILALKYGACFIPEPLTCWRRLGGNHSMVISNKSEIYTALIENATSLMQTEFSGLFPKEYIAAWRRQNYFHLHYNIYKKISQEKIAKLSVLGESMGLAGGLWIRCFRFFSFLEKAFIVCFLYGLFKRNPWRACFNRITYFIIRCRYGFRFKFSK